MLNLRVRSDVSTVVGGLIPLRVNIATLVSALLVLVAGTIVFNDQITGRRAALAEARASFQSSGATARLEVEALGGPVETAVESTVATISVLPLEKIVSIETVKLFAQRLSETDRMYALYYGDQQGNFVMVFSLALAAPEAGAAFLAWIIQRPTSSEFQQTVLTLDEEYGILSTDLDQHNGFDPRTRPWFHPAINSGRIVTIPPYVYAETNDVGITLAARTPDSQGVVGGDLILKTLSEALGQVGRLDGTSLSVVFDNETGILAAANVDHVLEVRRPEERPIVTRQTLASTGVPAYQALSRLYASGERDGLFEATAATEDWVIWMSPFRLNQEGDATIAILAPSHEVFAEVNQRMRLSLAISAIGVGVGLLLAWLVASSIAKPIRILTNEAFQMRNFDLSESPPVRSRIREVQRLSQSVQTLKRAMTDFGRYVPTQLVRRLVAGDMTAEIGGERLEVSLLFTDIADFTAISEEMEPVVLMEELSEYLAEASKSLIEHGATIDKYVGDAIMAMWNAPLPQENHVELACQAALETASVINALNERRVATGRRPFHTRFGLHVGVAVVGNVGSEDRMDYTALGGTVNLASRLEGHNKQLGTQILVSEAVMAAIPKQFATRPVDAVRLKGTTRPVHVFELMSSGQNSGTGDDEEHLESWRECYAAYTQRRWAEALNKLDEHIQHFASDTAAKTLQARATSYAESPPPEDWDGVFEALTK